MLAQSCQSYYVGVRGGEEWARVRYSEALIVPGRKLLMAGLGGRSRCRVIVGPLTQDEKGQGGSKCPWSVLGGLGEELTGGMERDPRSEGTRNSLVWEL